MLFIYICWRGAEIAIVHTIYVTYILTLHCITLHYLTLHYIKIHCSELHYSTVRYITLPYIAYIHAHTHIWYDMIWDIIWDMVWYIKWDMISYDMLCCMTCHDNIYIYVLYDMIYDMRYDICIYQYVYFYNLPIYIYISINHQYIYIYLSYQYGGCRWLAKQQNWCLAKALTLSSRAGQIIAFQHSVHIYFYKDKLLKPHCSHTIEKSGAVLLCLHSELGYQTGSSW